MPRILGVDIPNDKPTHIALRYLYGIGPTTSLRLCEQAKVNPQRRAKDLTIFLRGQLDRAALPEQVREQVQAIDAELPVFEARMLDDVLADSLSARRFSMEMVALFAGTALLLAALGIYGTISYVVSEQTREFGIRLALGADRGVIMKLVLRQGG